MSLKTEGDISPELKVAARDLHYTLIEQYGLKDDPVSNHAIREGLHQLMRLAATASEKDAARYRHIKAHAAVSFDDEIRWTTATGAVIFTHSAAQHELDLITDAAILAKGDRS